MLESICALLFDIRVPVTSRPAPREWTFPSIPHVNWSGFPAPIKVLHCQSPLSIDSILREKFRNDPFRVAKASKQIRSVSKSRIEWESKPGANIMKMTISALREIITTDGGRKMDCEVTKNGLRFQVGDMSLDVQEVENGGMAVFTLFSDHHRSVPGTLERAAVDSIAADMSNNVRSYSWSSGDRVFDQHNPLGEMESMIHHFFGDRPDVFSHQIGPETFSHPSPARPEIPQRGQADAELESMGVQVIIPNSTQASSKVDWSKLAGYDKVKSQVEESVILGLKHPSLFDKITRKTRGSMSSNKPKVVLFEGPPGTGKSSTAKIIAHETNVPMIHVPLESVVSKWFGESEKQIARIYDLAKQVAHAHNANSVILFIDEIDSLVSSRDSGTPHEASKRILSVMLRQIDGFNADDSVQCTLICATNRKKDLDSAFLSRVDSSIHFGLPGEDSRAKILNLYAKHLTSQDLEQIASITDGLSGRNLKDVCHAAERRWAAQFVRELRDDVEDDDVEVSPPPVQIYIDAAKEKFNQQLS